MRWASRAVRHGSCRSLPGGRGRPRSSSKSAIQGTAFRPGRWNGSSILSSPPSPTGWEWDSPSAARSWSPMVAASGRWRTSHGEPSSSSRFRRASPTAVQTLESCFEVRCTAGGPHTRYTLQQPQVAARGARHGSKLVGTGTGCRPEAALVGPAIRRGPAGSAVRPLSSTREGRFRNDARAGSCGPRPVPGGAIAAAARVLTAVRAGRGVGRSCARPRPRGRRADAAAGGSARRVSRPPGGPADGCDPLPAHRRRSLRRPRPVACARDHPQGHPACERRGRSGCRCSAPVRVRCRLARSARTSGCRPCRDRRDRSGLHGADAILLPETMAAYGEQIVALAERRTPFNAETALRSLTGERIDVLLSMSVPPQPAKLDDVLVAFVDLRERKATEEALLRAREELARVTRVSTVGELAASIAHEINQPLAAMASYAGAALLWLQRAPPDIERARDTVERTIREGEHAAEIVSRVRALVKKAPPRTEPVEINELILEVLDLT